MTKVASLEIEIAANVARLTEDFGKAKAEVTSSMNRIKAQVAESMKGVIESVDSVNKHIKGMQDAFAAISEIAIGGVIGEKILNLGKDFAEASEQITRTAQMTGMTTDQVQQLGYAATATGASSESMTIAMRKLSTMMLQAENGSKTAVAAFKNVGISQEEIKNSSPHDVLMKVSDAYANSADGADKAANAQMLFGRAGMDLIPTLNQGSKGLEALGNRANDLGIVLSDKVIQEGEQANLKFKEMDAVTSAASKKIGAEMVPAMTAMARAFVDSAQDGGALSAVMKGLNAIIVGATVVISGITTALTMMGDAIAAAAATIAHPMSAKSIWKSWGEDVDALQAKEDKVVASLKDAKSEATTGAAPDSSKTGFIGSDTGTGPSTRSHHAKAKDGTDSIIASYRKEAEAELSEMHKIESERLRMGDEEVSSAQNTSMTQIAIKEEQAKAMLKSGQITEQQFLQMKQKYENQKYQIEIDAQQKRIALAKGNPDEDPVALQRLLDQLKAIQEKHALDVATMQADAATKTKNVWVDAFKPITQAFDTTVKGMIMGTTTWQKGVTNLLNSVVAEFVNAGVRMVTQWATNELAKTTATQVGVTTRTAAQVAGDQQGLASSAMTVIASIMNDAAKVFSGVWSALSGIPYVGPVLAAVAAPAAMATVAAVAGSVSSSAGGDWQIPADRLNFVNKNETILPADKSAGLDSLIKSGGGGDTHVHIHATDADSVKRMFAQNGSAIMDAIRSQVRGGALTGIR